jgi:hypothetical protein
MLTRILRCFLSFALAGGLVVVFTLSAETSREISSTDGSGFTTKRVVDPSAMYRAWARSCSRCQQAVWSAAMSR